MRARRPTFNGNLKCSYDARKTWQEKAKITGKINGADQMNTGCSRVESPPVREVSLS